MVKQLQLRGQVVGALPSEEHPQLNSGVGVAGYADLRMLYDDVRRSRPNCQDLFVGRGVGVAELLADELLAWEAQIAIFLHRRDLHTFGGLQMDLTVGMSNDSIFQIQTNI